MAKHEQKQPQIMYEREMYCFEQVLVPGFESRAQQIERRLGCLDSSGQS